MRNINLKICLGMPYGTHLKMTAILLVVICSTAPAKTIYVDKDATVGLAIPDGRANNGSRWENAYVYLQDALADANESEKPVEIRVAQGIYKPNGGIVAIPEFDWRTLTFQLASGVSLKGGYAGVGSPDPNARDIILYETILFGDLNGDDVEITDSHDLIDEPTRADNSYHVVTSDKTDANTILDGFTITAGNANGIEPHNSGGGLYNLQSDLTLLNCNFHRNTSVSSGGAMFSSGGHPLLDSCMFKCNHASGGGAIAFRVVNSKLINCTFMNNSSLYWGGALESYGQYIELVNCIFVNNSSGQSGGSFNNSSSSATLIGCEFITNKSGDGGGAIVNQGCNANLTNCIFISNYAKNKGGAIFSRVRTDLNLINCTFHCNSSDWSGGSLFNSYSNAAIKNCIMWDNSAPNGTEISLTPFDYPSSASVAYSDIKNGISALHVDDNCTIVWGDGNIDADPLFAKPGYWADANDPNQIVEPNDPNAIWIDGDYHLKSQTGRYDPNSDSWIIDDVTSPCIDTGDPNSPVDDEPEPNGGRINMGAYGGTWQASMSLSTEEEPKLIAHRAFDESDGDIAYDSAGVIDAIVHNGAWTAGKVDGALRLNGLNTYVDCGDSELLGPEQMTISMWIKPEHMGGMRYILSRTSIDSDDIDYNIQRHYEGKVEFDVGQADSQPVSVLSNSKTVLNEWSHVAASLDGSETSVYINGQLDSSVSYSQRFPRGESYRLVISSLKANTRFYNGLIDDVRIYNYALSENEIEALAH